MAATDTMRKHYVVMTDGAGAYWRFYVLCHFSLVISTSRKFFRGAKVTSTSVASPTVVTTSSPHGFTTGDTVYFSGHERSTPSINGNPYTVTVTGLSTFTIPVAITVAGEGATVAR